MSKVSHGDDAATATQRIITACALMHEFDGTLKILLARRAMTKKFQPGKYELPGGHIAFGEDMVAGLQRAVLAELGVRIAVEHPFAAFGYINEARGAHTVKIVYLAKLLSPPESISLRPEVHSDFKWLCRDELELAEYPHGDSELAAITRAFTLYG
jgi:8-oxo-dGTP diphosphatase